MEDLFEAATTTKGGPTASASLALTTLEPSNPEINELLSRCRKDMSRLEAKLKQYSGQKKIRGPPPSTGLEVVLRDLALSTTALKDVTAGDRR